MNKFFFLMPVIIAILLTPSVAFGEQGPPQITRYKDYQVIKNADGSGSNTYGLPEYVYDGANWVDRIIQNNGTHFNVYSAQGSFSFDKNTCMMTQYVRGFDPTTQAAKSSDITIRQWYWTIARQNGANPWQMIDASIFDCGISTFSNSTGKYMSETRVHPASGSKLTVTVAAPNGENVEDFGALFMNVSAWGGNKFAPILWAKGVSIDSLVLRNGTELAIPQGVTTVDRSQLSVSSLDFVKNGNAFFFDWKKMAPQFKSLILNKTGTNIDVQFVFNNNAVTLNQGDTMRWDPSYGYSYASNQKYSITANGAGAGCPNPSSLSTTTYQLQKYRSTASGQCIVAAFQWNLTSLPTPIDINTVTIKYSVNTGSALTCDFTEVANNILTGTATSIWLDVNNTGGGHTYVTGDTTCKTAGSGKTVALGSQAASDIEARQSTDKKFGLGMLFTDMVRDGTIYAPDWVATGANNFQLQINYTIRPNTVTDLTATPVDGAEIDLAWTEPNLNGGTLQGYQINYTTPCGEPNTMITNNSGTDILYSVTGLTDGSCYSFRVGVWNNVGLNASGNIANATATQFVAANFTIGNISFNATNPNRAPISFIRTDTSATSSVITVRYLSTYNMSCTLHTVLGQTTTTYSGLNGTAYTADSRFNVFNFTFTNPANDVVDITCRDTATNETGVYELTQSEFPLKQIINNFRNGTYGTMGQIGVLDFISVIVVIIAMIGFNRTNESVALFFAAAALGALTYFEIISWPAALLSALALVGIIIVMITRKT